MISALGAEVRFLRINENGNQMERSLTQSSAGPAFRRRLSETRKGRLERMSRRGRSTSAQRSF